MKYILTLLSLSFLFHCSNTSAVRENLVEKKLTYEEMSTIQKIERRHKKEKFLSRDNVRFDLELFFRGKERLNGTLTLATNSFKGLIEMNNGNKVYFIKDKVYFTPGMNEKKARFDAYTWSYFFLLPYKLSDKGTIWSESEKVKMNGEEYNSQLLTFEKGTGDTFEDWYQVYSDTNSDLIKVAAYIVTANNSIEKAEEDPHAIVYQNYQMLNAIPVATEWKFYEWTKADGLADTLGRGKLSNFVFVENFDSLFIPPTDFIKI